MIDLTLMTELYRSFNFLDFEASNSALVKYQLTIQYCIYCTLPFVMTLVKVKVIRRLIDVTVNIRNFTVISILKEETLNLC